MVHSALIGCIVGTAVGDALGLPYEGLSPRRARQMFGSPDRHRFFGSRGMVSDDTEHACIVAQSLIAAGDDVEKFANELARRLRWWLLFFPAGVGRATLVSILRLWLGYRPENSGIFSAGNGPAMRAPILGAAITDLDALHRFVRASTRLTHSDPKAEHGALAVALAARMTCEDGLVSPGEFLDRTAAFVGPQGCELIGLIHQATESVCARQSTVSFAKSLGLSRGVSGYTLHTVPVALHAWLSHQRDFRPAVLSIIECGGDTDSTAAIVGGLVGSAVGKTGIPAEWLSRLMEWPRTVSWMEQLGEQLSETLASHHPSRPVRVNPLAIVARNLFFLIVVLFHGFRRLLPPY